MARPGDALACNNLAWARGGQAAAVLVAVGPRGESRAVKLVDDAIALDARPGGAWTNRGAALCELARWAEAVPRDAMAGANLL